MTVIKHTPSEYSLLEIAYVLVQVVFLFVYIHNIYIFIYIFVSSSPAHDVSGLPHALIMFFVNQCAMHEIFVNTTCIYIFWYPQAPLTVTYGVSGSPQAFLFVCLLRNDMPLCSQTFLSICVNV